MIARILIVLALFSTPALAEDFTKSRSRLCPVAVIELDDVVGSAADVCEGWPGDRTAMLSSSIEGIVSFLMPSPKPFTGKQTLWFRTEATEGPGHLQALMIVDGIDIGFSEFGFEEGPARWHAVSFVLPANSKHFELVILFGGQPGDTPCGTFACTLLREVRWWARAE